MPSPLSLPLRRSLSLPRPLRRRHRAKPRLVVVGNGMAAIRLIEEIQALAPGLHDITVFGAERSGHYNRVQLSSLLAGDKSLADILTHPPTWYATHGITLHAGDPVTAIDVPARTVTTAGGQVCPWDQLILATGAAPILPPLPGMDLANVVGFRDLDDVDTMLAAAREHRHAVVVGGGVLGLEAAWGLKAQGMDVTVVHMMDWLMDRQIDGPGGALLRRRLEEQHIRCLTGAEAAAIEGEGRVQAVRLTDGARLVADLVVMAVGIRPRVDLARAAGLTVGRGIVVDERLRTSQDGIFAVGECVEFQGQTFGLVKPLYDMALVLARDLTGQAGAAFTVPPQSTVLKIPTIPLFAAGDRLHPREDQGERAVVHHDPETGVYKKVLLRHGRVVATVLMGDTSDSARVWQWMRQGDDVGHLDQQALCLGCTGCDGADVAVLEDDAIVCQCNHVTKGAIAAAIRQHRLTRLEQVTRTTRAGLTCGQCSVRVAAILAAEQGQAAPDLDALAARLHSQHRAFTWWHRGHASLMSLLLFTGLGLHFSYSWLNPVGFEWSLRLHEWSGLAVCAGFVVFLGLTKFYRRRWQKGADSAAMFVFMPLITLSGLIFLWPDLLPAQLGERRATLWVALAHLSFGLLIAMYLIHHLANAPFRWWAKRRLRSNSSPSASNRFGRLFFRKGYANEIH